jgi:hypothetical protein
MATAECDRLPNPFQNPFSLLELAVGPGFRGDDSCVEGRRNNQYMDKFCTGFELTTWVRLAVKRR